MTVVLKYIFIFISFGTFAQTIAPKHELLWEISGGESKGVSYLFGSLHSNDKRLFNLSDSTYVALDRSKMVVLEADVFSLFETLDTRRQEVVVNYDNEGQPYTSDNLPTQTVYGDEDGAPQFLDAYFQQYCYNAGKSFEALETVESQLEIFDNVSLPEFSQMRLESFLTSKEQMIELYLDGDIYGLNDLMRMSLAVYPDLYDDMIVRRNEEMSVKIDSLLKENEMFCAVGAGHLAGSAGLINILRMKGYKLRKVLATYTEVDVPEKKMVRSQRYYDYIADSLGMHVRLPGKPLELIQDDYEDYEVKLIFREFGQGNTYEVEIYRRRFDIGLEDLASRYIPSPAESPYKKIQLDNGGEAVEGLADSYPFGLYWVRVIMAEDTFAVIKCYGGNKFMNSNRPKRFFDQVWFH